jgi:hypothetical protein
MNEMQSAFLNYGPYSSSSNPDIYSFSGNSYSINLKSNEISAEELSRYRSLRINVSGTMVKNNSLCCYWNTIIWGSIFLFPLFFICCDWWKRIVNRIFEVNVEGYEGVARMILNSRAEDVYIMVQDNLFNAVKAQILIRALERSAVRNLVFTNLAVGFNAEGHNYSDFEVYMKQIKGMHMKSDISWANNFVM